MSSRLYPLTLDKPKCLLELAEGKAIIDHQIEILREVGVEDVIIVVGYLQKMIIKHVGDKARYRIFNDFAKFNNLHTLYSIKDELNDDIVILYSDVVFGKDLLKKCVTSKEDYCLLVHNREVLKDTARVKILNGGIVDIGNHISVEDGDGNFIGIAKYSKDGIKKLIVEMGKMINDPKHFNDYYMVPLINLGKSERIGFELVHNDPWIEIDFLADYEKAKKLYHQIKNH